MDDSEKLGNQLTDYLATSARAVLGAVPGVGSVLAELAGAVIPNQRMDRVARFATDLRQRVGRLEQANLARALTSPALGDLVMESMRQAAGALSEERLAYLGSLVENSLDEERVSVEDSRRLLHILGQLNDVEVILLRSYLVQTMQGDDAFRTANAAVLEPAAAFLGSEQAVHDKSAMQTAYRQHLTQLGLLHERLKIDTKTKQPVFDSSRGRFATTGLDLTPMGRLVLRMIGLTRDGFRPAQDDD